MKNVEVIMHVPRSEFLKIEKIVASMAEQAKSFVPNARPDTTVNTPNPTVLLLSFAYRELRAETQEARNNGEIAIGGTKFQMVGEFGKAKLPSWIFDKKPQMLTLSFTMNSSKYNQMMSWIQQLYPTVFFNPKINKNDVIAALGACYAERILSGQVQTRGKIVGSS